MIFPRADDVVSFGLPHQMLVASGNDCVGRQYWFGTAVTVGQRYRERLAPDRDDDEPAILEQKEPP